jgi:hypothetical protein
MRALEGGRIAIAAQALGLGQAALDEAVGYARRREVFGQSIGDFQAVQFQLADLATELDAARMLTWRAADATIESRASALEASMAKLTPPKPRTAPPTAHADSSPPRLPPRLNRGAHLPRRPRAGDLPGTSGSEADDYCGTS